MTTLPSLSKPPARKSSMRAPMLVVALTGAILGLLRSTPELRGADELRIESSHRIAEPAPTPESHASTIVETGDGLLASWFGGTAEKNPDVGIYVSRFKGGAWTMPEKVAEGTEDGPTRYPCWNPVLFLARSGPLFLFYKVGPTPATWWGRVMTSTNNGRTWSRSARLPETILGPVRNKPVSLSDGTLLSGSSTEHDGWRVHLERLQLPVPNPATAANAGPNVGAWDPAEWKWQRSSPLHTVDQFEAIQPTVLVWDSSRLQILCRTRTQKVVSQSWSLDGGWTWSGMTATPLPNPNSGIDGLVLKDGRGLLVHNNTARGRGVLGIALSRDGKDWHQALELENSDGEFSYPAVIQAQDGRIHVTYTWRRRAIQHVVIAP